MRRAAVLVRRFRALSFATGLATAVLCPGAFAVGGPVTAPSHDGTAHGEPAVEYRTCTSGAIGAVEPTASPPSADRSSPWLTSRLNRGMRYSTMRDGPGSFRPLWQDIQFARNVWVFPGSTRFLWMNVSTDGVYEVAIGDRHWSVPVVEGTRQSLVVDGLAAGEQAISITLRRNDGQLATVRESFRVLDDVTAVCVRQRMAAIEQASGGDQLLVAAYLEEEGLWFEAVDRLERSDARLHREYVGLLYSVYRNSGLFWEWWTVWQCASPEFGACPLPPDGTVRDTKARASRDR